MECGIVEDGYRNMGELLCTFTIGLDIILSTKVERFG